MLLFYVRHGDPIYDPDSLTQQGLKQADALAERMKFRYKPEKIYASSSNRAILTAKPTAKALGKEIEILDWCNEGHAWKELSCEHGNGKRHWAMGKGENIPFFASEEVRRLDMDWYKHPVFEQSKLSAKQIAENDLTGADLSISVHKSEKTSYCFDRNGFEAGMERIGSLTDDFMLALGFCHDRERFGYTVVEPKDGEKRYERVALFAHGGFGAGFLSNLLDIPYPIMSTRFSLSHSGVTVIRFESGITNTDLVIPEVLQWSCDSHLYAAGLPTAYNNVVEI